MIEKSYEIIINNNISYVFNNILGGKEQEIWFKAFSEATKIVGEFKLGAEILFVDVATNHKMKSKITKYEVNKVIELCYLGEFKNDKYIEYPNHDNFERYLFTKVDDKKTLVTAQMRMPKDFEAEFDKMWKNATILLQDAFDLDKKQEEVK